MQIISLDKDRVKIYDDFVLKKSSKKEFDFLNKARDICLKMEPIKINDVIYKIRIPKVYSFEDNILKLERCFGKNLEIMLRENEHQHKLGVDFTNSLLLYFIENEFFWEDFAPRNILIDFAEKQINIMDFERGILDSIDNYFYNIVYEEYSAFLLPEERIYHEDDIFKTNKDELIHLSDISSNRIRTILKIQGYTNFVPFSAYLLANKMIVINEEPYRTKNRICFPIIELEDYKNKEGYEKYSMKIIGGYNEKCNSKSKKI